MGYMGMCGPNGYGFVAVLVSKMASILTILDVSNRIRVLHSSFEFGEIFSRGCFFIISDKTIHRGLSKASNIGFIRDLP